VKLKQYLLFLTLSLPSYGMAQSISPAQIERFQQLPRAQQEALAAQYGLNLGRIEAGSNAVQRPQPVTVVARLPEAPVEPTAASVQSAGQAPGALEPFGYDLFAGAPTTFAPVTEIPVPSEYALGPGDVLQVHLWGQENRRLELPVSRDGAILFPQHGPMNVVGLSFDEVRRQIQARVSEQYMGVEASVTLGELRSMRVFVLGDARTPGAYTVSSLSTITNALYVSGGVKRSGSLRNVQHKRNGELLGTLDLYDLLLKGDTSDDARLQPGDVIFIPPVGSRVGVEGEVYRPGLYELNGETSLGELLNLAGGMTPQAYPQRISIERTNAEFLRVMLEADGSIPQGMNQSVQPGDLLLVPAISDITGQYVEVHGAAARPGRFAWVPGMRVSSVLRNLETDLQPIADKHYAAIVRTDPQTDRVSVLNLHLREAVLTPAGPHDLQLEEGDQLLVFSDIGKVEGDGGQGPGNRAQSAYSRQTLLAPVLRRLKAQASPGAPQQTIRITGPVRYPGEYPMPANRSLADAVFVAGGLQDTASLFRAEVARHGVDEHGVGQTRIINVNLAQVLSGESDLVLHSRDTILIQAIPEFGVVRTITLAGEIRYPGEYTFREGETLREVLHRAGGVTPNAFPKGAVFTRAKLRQLEAQRLREAEDRLQGELLGIQLESDSLAGQNAERQESAQALLEDIKQSRAVGRLVIDLEAVLQDNTDQPIRLLDGDMLSVPGIPQSVSVFGEVQFPTSHLYEPGLTAEDYLDRSGGPTRQADEDRVYIIKADGSVRLPETSRWFAGASQQLEPGDTIIMPVDVDRLNQLELWASVSQIVYQIALGAAAVGNL